MTWAVNVLAPYLLTSLLLDKIKARIVNVSSLSACGSVDFNNLQQERGYRYSICGAGCLVLVGPKLNTFGMDSLPGNFTWIQQSWQ